MEQLVYNFSMHHLPAKQLEKAQVNFCFLLKGQILAMSNFTTFKYFKFDLHRNKKKTINTTELAPFYPIHLEIQQLSILKNIWLENC